MRRRGDEFAKAAAKHYESCKTIDVRSPTRRDRLLELRRVSERHLRSRVLVEMTEGASTVTGKGRINFRHQAYLRHQKYKYANDRSVAATGSLLVYLFVESAYGEAGMVVEPQRHGRMG